LKTVKENIMYLCLLEKSFQDARIHGLSGERKYFVRMLDAIDQVKETFVIREDIMIFVLKVKINTGTEINVANDGFYSAAFIQPGQISLFDAYKPSWEADENLSGVNTPKQQYRKAK
jgi:hypothetical protein